MTQEEKAKAYDEAIEKAKEYFNSPRTCFDIEQLCNIFTELKESKDERIRKRIIHALHGDVLEMSEIKEAVAWLEKQGNLMKALQISNSRIAELVKEKYNLEEKLKKQGEQKPADLKTKAGNWYICDMEVMNENMVTAFHRDEIYYCPKDGYLDVRGALFEVGCLDVFRLATEKEIPQPKHKPAWSEEDENLFKCAIDAVREESKVRTDGCLDEEVGGMVTNWLKSLKDRYTWKPSDEQMLAINTAINVVGKGTINGKYLVELQEQLKKLREE